MIKFLILIGALLHSQAVISKTCEDHLITPVAHIQGALIQHYGLRGATRESGLDYSEYGIRANWLHMATMTPYHQHHPLMLRVLKDYIDLKKYPPLNIKEAKFIPRTEAKTCGTCSARTSGFFNSFIEPVKNYYTNQKINPEIYRLGRVGKFVLVFSGPNLLGVIKAVGIDTPTQTLDGRYFHSTSNPTFLALRNVTNSQGQLILAMGGIYFLSTKIWHEFIDAINAQGPYESIAIDASGVSGNYQAFAKDFAVGYINIKTLEVTPVSQFANLPYASDQLTILKKLYNPGVGLTKTEYNRYLKKHPNYDSALIAEVNRTLDFLRAQIEGEIHKNSNLDQLQQAIKKASQDIYDYYGGF